MTDSGRQDARVQQGQPNAPASSLLQEALRLHRQGALAEATKLYSQVLRSEPTNGDASYYLAMAHCQQGRFAEAVDHARRAAVAAPKNARAHHLVGIALHRLGRHDEALA